METFKTFIGEAEVEVGFDYFPSERQTWDYPGCDEEVDITSIKYQGKEIDVKDSACVDFVTEALEHIHKLQEESYIYQREEY